MKREPLVELQREDEQALLLGEPSRQSLFVVERQEQEGAMVSCYAPAPFVPRHLGTGAAISPRWAVRLRLSLVAGALGVLAALALWLPQSASASYSCYFEPGHSGSCFYGYMPYGGKGSSYVTLFNGMFMNNQSSGTHRRMDWRTGISSGTVIKTYLTTSTVAGWSVSHGFVEWAPWCINNSSGGVNVMCGTSAP
jgi:hypothetical protein